MGLRFMRLEGQAAATAPVKRASKVPQLDKLSNAGNTGAGPGGGKGAVPMWPQTKQRNRTRGTSQATVNAA